MAETKKIDMPRPDVDIAEDIDRIIHRYPPLTNDRHHVEVAVDNGKVTVTGYVKAPATYDYLLNGIDEIRGVKKVDVKKFYVDEELRLDVGRVIPMGVQVRVEYGAVILTGALPEGTKVEALVKKVGKIKGVKRVLTGFN